MKYLFRISLLSFLILLTGCVSDKPEDIIIDRFPQTIQLKGKYVSNIEFVAGYNVRICVVDTFLILQRQNGKMIQVYSTNSHQLLIEFGDEGRGPGEFVKPKLMRQSGRDSANNNPLVYIYDPGRRRIVTIDLLSTINNPRHESIFETIPDNITTYLYDILYRNDTMLLSNPEFGGRFLLYKKNTATQELIPFIPEIDFKGINEQLLKMIYQSSCCVNEDKGLIAAASLCTGEINFFDFELDYIKSTIFIPRNMIVESFKNIKTPVFPILYITELLSNNDHIYGLNYSNPSNVFSANNDIERMKIQVFNWDGQPVKEYVLDQLINAFAIDSSHNRIYGYDPRQGKNNIILYNLE